MQKPLFTSVVTVALIVVSVVWLSAAPTIGTTAATPAVIGVNTATNVIITAQITDSTLLPSSVNLLRIDSNGRTLANLGVMSDSGTGGDLIPGDRMYSRSITLNEAQTGDAHFQVSAAFKGALRRILSVPIVVTIAHSFHDSGVSFPYPEVFAERAIASAHPLVVRAAALDHVNDPTQNVTVTVYPDTASQDLDSWYDVSIRGHEFVRGSNTAAASRRTVSCNGAEGLEVVSTLFDYTATRVFCRGSGHIVGLTNVRAVGASGPLEMQAMADGFMPR